MVPRNNKEICEIARKHGWKSVAPGTVSSCLERAKGLAILSGIEGYKLTDEGQDHVKALAEHRIAAQPPAIASALRSHLQKISDLETKAFVEEAVHCLEHGLHRSAVVMSWVGAVHLLYRHVHQHRLTDFNSEATTRFQNSKPPWKPAKSIDDLALMSESNFLEVLQAISVIGKNVKTALKACLDRRNSCGHPNSYKISGAVTSAHVEELLLNVYEKF